MIYYPVIIPTLCRYEKFKACVDSLANCAEAQYTELVIGYDYPPSDEYRDGWEKIGEFIKTIQGFKKVTVIAQSKNIGSGKNCDILKEYALNKYDAYIYSEDDNLFSPFFLRFINEGLDKYKTDYSVIAICGYSYPIDWKTNKDCVLQNQYFSAWGYGIWKDRFTTLCTDIKSENFRDSILDKEKRRKLIKSPKNFLASQGFIFDDNIYPCDITISAYNYLHHKSVLMPVISLARNTGWDGSGEHCITDRHNFSNQPINCSKQVSIEPEIIEYSKELEVFQKKLVRKWNFQYFRVLCVHFIVRILGKNNARKLREFRKNIK